MHKNQCLKRSPKAEKLFRYDKLFKLMKVNTELLSRTWRAPYILVVVFLKLFLWNQVWGTFWVQDIKKVAKLHSDLFFFFVMAKNKEVNKQSNFNANFYIWRAVQNDMIQTYLTYSFSCQITKCSSNFGNYNVSHLRTDVKGDYNIHGTKYF